MKHSRFRKFLFALLAFSAVFALASWFLPYEWNPDPAARFKIAATQVKRDRSYYWITVHLRKTGDAGHDMMKPVRLISGNSEEIQAADVTFGGSKETGTDEMWLKFWVPEESTSGTLFLKLNDGRLTVKSSEGMPPIGDSMMRTFTNPRW